MRVGEEPVTDQSILWRRLDQPGHESGRLFFQHSCWNLVGTAVFAHDHRPCRLDYAVVCNAGWQTLFGRVTGWIGNATIEIEIAADSAHRWRVSGTDCPGVEGCIDLDLGFTPSTNSIPIRRLGLSIGQEAEVRAAWLGFPSFTLEPLPQLYRRIDVATYRYESAGGRFVADLQVNAAGLVTRYPNFWQVEAGS